MRQVSEGWDELATKTNEEQQTTLIFEVMHQGNSSMKNLGPGKMRVTIVDEDSLVVGDNRKQVIELV